MKSRPERSSPAAASSSFPVVVAAVVVLAALSSLSAAASFSLAPPLSLPSSSRTNVFPSSSRVSLPTTVRRRRTSATTTALSAKKKASSKQLPALENWKLDRFDRIIGTIYDHPTIDDGDVVTTSPLSDPSDAADDASVKTKSGSKYRLGASMRRNAVATPPSPRKRGEPPTVSSYYRSKTIETSSSSSRGGGRSRRRRVSLASSPPRASAPTLDEWTIVRFGGRPCVTGIVYDHPNYDDGDVVTTSPLSASVLDAEKAREGSTVTTTSGSKYALGKKRAKKEKATKPKKKDAFSGLWSSWTKKPKGDPATRNDDGGEGVDEASDEPPLVVVPAPSNRDDVVVNPTIERVSLPERKRQAKIQYDLTGDVAGAGGPDGNQYLLSGKPYRSTSGKSTIYSAYLSDDDDGLPTGEPLAIKVCSNVDSLSRERDNYDKIENLGRRYVDRFVKRIEYLERWNGPTFAKYGAIVVEAGTKDLKEVLAERRNGDDGGEEEGKGGGLDGREMRDAAYAAALCVQAVHAAGLVWTDLKPENFVVLPSSTSPSDEGNDDDDDVSEDRRRRAAAGGDEVRRVRGIDLESAIPKGETPVDYSPEACPPEFARAFLEGEGLNFVLNDSYDVWSLGMLLYELAVGSSYFQGMTPGEITERLSEDDFRANVRRVKRNRLRNLIEICLNVDPKKRPSIDEVLRHPYFVTTRMGWL